MDITYDKLILAVLGGDDASDTVMDLNEHGFYATLLSSTGGFLKKKSVTLMIGLDSADLDEVTAIIRKHAGKRAEVTYINPGDAKAAPVKVNTNGSVAFVLNVDKSLKF